MFAHPLILGTLYLCCISEVTDDHAEAMEELIDGFVETIGRCKNLKKLVVDDLAIDYQLEDAVPDSIVDWSGIRNACDTNKIELIV